jgi:hypothetical protein
MQQPTYFRIGGPFDVPTTGPTGWRRIDEYELEGFWSGAPREWADLIGCYVFGLRVPRGAIYPIYVGKTNSQTFARECFHSDKLVKVQNGMTGNSGSLVLFFAGRERSRRNESGRDIRKLEKYLIRHAAMRLEEAGRSDLLVNKHHAELKDRFAIQGVHRNPDGRSTTPTSSREFQRAMGIRGLNDGSQ